MDQGARWVTFDCYGTLVDWLSGMRTAIGQVAPGHEEALLAAYHELESQVESGPFRPYRQVLEETLSQAAAACGVVLQPPGATVLADTLPDWPVFLDVAAGLGGLRAAGWRLAILSNVDDELLDGTRSRLPVPIDLAVTAQQVRAYKPADAHFLTFRERAAPAQWVHVAQGLLHDMAPTRRLRIPRVWVNRQGEPEPPDAADAVIGDLTDLTATVERVATASGP